MNTVKALVIAGLITTLSVNAMDKATAAPQKTSVAESKDQPTSLDYSKLTLKQIIEFDKNPTKEWALLKAARAAETLAAKRELDHKYSYMDPYYIQYHRDKQDMSNLEDNIEYWTKIAASL